MKKNVILRREYGTNMADIIEVSEDYYVAKKVLYLSAGYVPYFEKEESKQNDVALDDTSNKVSEEGEKQNKK